MKQTEKALFRSHALANPPSTSTDLTKLKDNLRSVGNSLKRIGGQFEKIQSTLRNMDNAHFLDDHYCIANDGDAYLLQLAAAEDKDSGFGIVIERLVEAVKDFEKESCVDGSKGRLKDTRFTGALVELADFFAVTFPEKKVSNNKGTVFKNFAGWYLSLYPGMTSPKRHIDNALEAWADRVSTPPK
jgi:hypothetical protein